MDRWTDRRIYTNDKDRRTDGQMDRVNPVCPPSSSLGGGGHNKLHAGCVKRALLRVWLLLNQDITGDIFFTSVTLKSMMAIWQSTRICVIPRRWSFKLIGQIVLQKMYGNWFDDLCYLSDLEIQDGFIHFMDFIPNFTLCVWCVCDRSPDRQFDTKPSLHTEVARRTGGIPTKTRQDKTGLSGWTEEVYLVF